MERPKEPNLCTKNIFGSQVSKVSIKLLFCKEFHKFADLNAVNGGDLWQQKAISKHIILFTLDKLAGNSNHDLMKVFATND